MTPTIIIGAGPAGLAVAGQLRGHDVPFEIIDRADRVASAWHRHYARLHLHTARRYSSLPGHPFPPDTPRWVPRADVVAYFTAYADAHALRPRFGETVTALAPAATGWTVTTDAATHTTPTVVVATGHNHTPNRPDFPGVDTFAGPVIHSRDYHDGAPYAGQRVLVVGCGNSGAEIAIDLFEHGARPTLVVRGPVHVVSRELFGRPSQYSTVLLDRLPRRVQRALHGLVARYVLPDLSALGLHRPRQSVYDHYHQTGRIPLIDVGTVDLIRQGHIAVAPGVTRVEPDAVHFADDTRRPFDAIVLATGYRNALARLFEAPDRYLDARGRPRAHGEALPDAPGLYFVGFKNPLTGALREIGIEAQRVAEHIARRHRERAGA